MRRLREVRRQPIYKPGYGSMGDNPVADGSQFTMASPGTPGRRPRTANCSNGIIDRLVKTMAAAPRNPQRV